jgi:hypothetical protein
MSDLVANHLTTTNPTFTAAPDSLSSGAIAGVVVGCIIALSIFALTVVCVLRKRRRRRALPLSAGAAPHEIDRSYMDAELDAESKPTEMPVSVDEPAELSGWSVAELDGSEMGDREVDSRENVGAEETKDKEAHKRKIRGRNKISS